jgi:hypothetical protein
MTHLSRAQIIWVACIGLVGLAGYFILHPSYTNRFRLTIEIDTPDGIKSGSSVIETTKWESGGWGPIEARGVRAEARGEAVFVDLGNDRFVVGLLGWGPIAQEEKIYSLTRDALSPGKQISWRDEPSLKGRGDLPPDDIPTLILTDRADVRTARVIPPSNLGRVLGSGVRLSRVRLETTDDPITSGLAQKLPFLVSQRDWMMHAYTDPRKFVPQYHLFIRAEK